MGEWEVGRGGGEVGRGGGEGRRGGGGRGGGGMGNRFMCISCFSKQLLQRKIVNILVWFSQNKSTSKIL